jgi:hypothetical protein
MIEKERKQWEEERISREKYIKEIGSIVER